MTENADRYRRAIAGFSAVVDAVPSDKWTSPSPCPDWTAAHVVGHVIGGAQMIASVKTGDTPNYEPLDAAGDDPAAGFAAARDVALETLTDEYLNATVQGPMGETPLDELVGMILANDVLIHTWDLAKSVGIDVTLDPQLAEDALKTLEPLDAVIRQERVFGAKVEPPADADVQTRLLCFVGRRP
ncbi:MAG: hypothetical protein QOF21_1494, partial [Actinomycetota bacterium]|jgi:uncharacterized protein (TIGR03086 family)